jgi:hypothetical protein
MVAVVKNNLVVAMSLLAAVFMISGRASAETAYFVVSEIASECSACDSYVLPLSDPAAIVHARNLVALGPAAGSTIALANVVEGGDGINRNVLAPGEPPWSWHVASFLDFGDFAIELCDGTPSMVEADPAGFLANTNGVICFWGYTVSAEIPVREVPMGREVGVLASLLVALAAWRLLSRARRAHTPGPGSAG